MCVHEDTSAAHLRGLHSETTHIKRNEFTQGASTFTMMQTKHSQFLFGVISASDGSNCYGSRSTAWVSHITRF